MENNIENKIKRLSEKNKIKRLIKKFSYAFAGLKNAVTNHSSFITHIIID